MKKILSVVFAFFFLLRMEAQTVRYVKPIASGTGDGSSWANASSGLQDMIDASASGDELWVAAGTYLPSRDPFGNAAPADPRDKTFFTKDGVKIYGGFNGTETAVNQRNWNTNITILSGDIGTPLINTDNCYHVIVSAHNGLSTVLDGLTITSGNADGPDFILLPGFIVVSRYDGGGIFLGTSSVSISNCNFSANTAAGGGGAISCYVSSSPVITNTVFTGNQANGSNGGAIDSFWGGTPVLTSCTFRSNSAIGNGGAINCDGHLTLTNCSFIDHTAGNYGGAVFAPDAAISNCLFSGNAANFAGALYVSGAATRADHCVFINNSAVVDGGALLANCPLVLKLNFFYNNRSNVYGGAISKTGLSTDSVIQCVFKNNTAAKGGALASSSLLHVFNSTFSGNSSTNSSSVYQYFSSSGEIINSIIRGDGIADDATSTTTASYSNIQGGYAGAGNIDADPLFADVNDPDGPDNTWGTADDGLRLQCGSPSIDAGRNDQIPPGTATDITGSPRILNTTVDMGAYEGAAPASYTLAMANVSDTRDQSGTVTYGDCSNLIATLASTGSAPVAGPTTARVWIETVPPPAFVKRHYEITPASNPSSSTGRVTLYFTQAEFDDFNAINTVKLPQSPADASGKANLLVEKRGGTSNDGSGLPGSYSGAVVTINPADADITWNSASNRWEVSFDVTGFSGLFVKVTSIPLPLKWLSVQGHLNNSRQAVLLWTVEERDVNGYEVEKSTDGITFRKAGSVTGKGDGNHEYNFTDGEPVNGVVYYRIRLIENDGRTSYSSIIRLSAEPRMNLSVYPTVFREGFTVAVQQEGRAWLLDAQGRMVKTMQLSAGANYIPGNELAAGLYILKTAGGESQKLIKEK
ncbi:MAG: right-handed parallel beta-helix repeat-containing protein [Chitinophagaceae bacterium]